MTTTSAIYIVLPEMDGISEESAKENDCGGKKNFMRCHQLSRSVHIRPKQSNPHRLVLANPGYQK